MLAGCSWRPWRTRIPPPPRLAAERAGPTACFWAGLFPLVARQWLAYSLYRGEMNLRAATIPRVVGAGGLGQQLYVSLEPVPVTIRPPP